MPKFTKLMRVEAKMNSSNLSDPRGLNYCNVLPLPHTCCLECLTSLSFTFLICEMGIILVTISKDECEAETKKGI